MDAAFVRKWRWPGWCRGDVVALPPGMARAEKGGRSGREGEDKQGVGDREKEK